MIKPKEIDWINFWNDKALSISDFEATGRGNMSIFGFIQTFHDCFNYLKPSKNDHFLDLGCGSGLLSIMISNFVKLVIGNDISKNMVKRARSNSKGIKNIKFYQSSITNLELKKKYFDKILIYSVLHYLNNLDEVKLVFNQLTKISKKESRILIAALPDKKRKKIYKKFVDENFVGEKKKIENEAIEKILWFDKNEFSEILNSFNFKFKLNNLNPNIWQSFYMFDCIIEGYNE